MDWEPGLIDANYCLWNGKAMGSCCIALRTLSSHLWWSMMETNVKKRMYTCMCDWVTLLYSSKLIEHSKPAIMEKITIIFLKKNKDIFSVCYQSEESMGQNECGWCVLWLLNVYSMPNSGKVSKGTVNCCCLWVMGKRRWYIRENSSWFPLCTLLYLLE